MILETLLKQEWDTSLFAAAERESLDAGFDAFGVAAAEAGDTAERFVQWIDQGYAGEMDWLKRRDEAGTLLRSAVRVALPWARSVVVCAMNYNADAPRSIDPAGSASGWIGRYAWSGRRVAGELVPTDYHDDLLARLRRVEAELKRHAVTSIPARWWSAMSRPRRESAGSAKTPACCVRIWAPGCCSAS